jgi:hypothetical protein
MAVFELSFAAATPVVTGGAVVADARVPVGTIFHAASAIATPAREINNALRFISSSRVRQGVQCNGTVRADSVLEPGAADAAGNARGSVAPTGFCVKFKRF